MILNSPYISGSLIVTSNGTISGSLTVLGGITGAITGSATSASYAISASEASKLQGLGSASFAPAGTFNTVSQSYATTSGSLSTRTTNLEATSSTVSASFASESGSMSSRVTTIESKYATTGSNTFSNLQYVSSSTNAQGFTTSASLYTDGGLRVGKDSFVSGTAYFNNVVVYGTSSIQYITSSQVNVGANIINLNTQTPAVRFGGMAVADSGSNAGITGSMLWDSVNNNWVYSNPSGSNYDGGMIISGPRNTSGLGNEKGTTACYLMAGQGADHITSSAVYTDSNATCFYGQSYISSSGAAVFASNLTGCGDLTLTSAGGHTLTMTATSAGSQTLTMTAAGGGSNTLTGTGGDFNLQTTGAYPLVIKTNSTERLRVDSAGIACFACQVCAPAFIGGTVDGTIINSTSNVFRFSGNNAISLVSLNAQNVVKINAAGYWGTQLVGANDKGILIDNTGLVGIGATTPSALLHICGAGTGVMLRLQNTSTASTDQGPLIQFMSANQVGGQNFESGYIQSIWQAEGNAFGMRFAVKNVDLSQAEVVRIKYNGNVGISTTNPQFKLDIQNGSLGIYHNTNYGGGSSGAQLYLGDMNFAGGGYACSAPGIGSVYAPSTLVAGDLAFYTYTGVVGCRAERMRIIGGGNVGIGTTTPAVPLQIRDSTVSSGGSAIHAYGYDGAANFYTTRAEDPFNAAVYMYNNPTSGPGIGTGIIFRAKSDTTVSQVQGAIYTTWTNCTDASRTARMVFQTVCSGTNSEKMTILGNGYVGIACSQPAYPLHVNGQIYSSTNVSAANSRILNQQSSNTWADNSAHTVTGAISEVSGIIRVINNLDGTNTDIPFYASGGSGVAYRWTVLDPDTGWIINTDGWNFNFTTNGSQSRTFNLQASNGSGNVTIQQASGTANYTMKIFIYAQA